MHILTQITFDHADEYKKFCAVMAEADLGEYVHPSANAKPAAPHKEKEATKKPVKVEPEEVDDEPEAEVDEKDAEDGDKEASAYEKIKELVLEVSEKKGKAAAKRALAAVGAEKVGPHIDAKLYPKLSAACKKELDKA